LYPTDVGVQQFRGGRVRAVVDAAAAQEEHGDVAQFGQEIALPAARALEDRGEQSWARLTLREGVERGWRSGEVLSLPVLDGPVRHLYHSAGPRSGRRLMFVRTLTITGHFTGISGAITLDERDPGTARAEVTIDAASIATGNARRDTHLRTADFFDVERYPALRFTSRRIAAIDATAGRYQVTGDLTIRDVTRAVQLGAYYNPPVAGIGEPRMMLTLTTGLHRADFGLRWSNPIITIADDLTVTLAVFLV